MPPRGKNLTQGKGISTNARWIAIVAILSVTILCIVWIYRPASTTPLETVHCADGSSHPVADATKFATQYWAYSVKLEGSLSNKAKIASTMEPKVLQQLSEAMQQGNAVREWLIISYNACAITQSNYDQYGWNFQKMDTVARNIQGVLDKGVQTDAERRDLSEMVDTYVHLAGGLRRSEQSPNKGEAR